MIQSIIIIQIKKTKFFLRDSTSCVTQVPGYLFMETNYLLKATTRTLQ